MPINPLPWRSQIYGRYIAKENGEVLSTARHFADGPLRLSLNVDKDGYPVAQLYLGGKKRWVHVHKLVAMFFLPERPSPLHEVRHLDGDNKNNNSSNLAWGTRKDNSDDKEQHGRMSRGKKHGLSRSYPKGEDCPGNKLSNSNRLEILIRFNLGEKQRDIAKHFGVTQATVWRSIRRAAYAIATSTLITVSATAAPRCIVGEIPDKSCSKGVVASTDEADVCGYINGLSYSKRHRQTPAGLKQLIRRRYGQEANHGDAEIDHILPLSLGGEDSVYNLFWQPGQGQGYRMTYREKDQLEALVWRRVCREHAMSLAEAQAIFLAPDWRPAYCQHIGGQVCGAQR